MTRAKGDLTPAAKRELQTLAETGTFDPRYGPWKQLHDAGLIQGGSVGDQRASTITQRGRQRVILWKEFAREDERWNRPSSSP